MITATALRKRFTSERLALDDVSFSVEKGQIVGLLGHNGAGKSTIVGIMLGMVRPDHGEVILGGISVQRHRTQALRQVGAIFEAPSFYEYMTGWQNLRALCALSGWWIDAEVHRVLELVRLSDRIHHKVATYSHGMRQRLALAQALLPMPRILLLDEPTDGLDPEGIHEFRSTILKLREEQNLTILMNSHLLSEVELMCDRCVVLHGGRKIYEGEVPSDGGLSAAQPRYQLLTPNPNLAAATLKALGAPYDPSSHLVSLPGGVSGPQLLARLVQAGVPIDSWSPFRQTLEDWYLQLTHSDPASNQQPPSPSS